MSCNYLLVRTNGNVVRAMICHGGQVAKDNCAIREALQQGGADHHRSAYNMCCYSCEGLLPGAA